MNPAPTPTSTPTYLHTKHPTHLHPNPPPHPPPPVQLLLLPGPHLYPHTKTHTHPCPYTCTSACTLAPNPTPYLYVHPHLHLHALTPTSRPTHTPTSIPTPVPPLGSPCRSHPPLIPLVFGVGDRLGSTAHGHPAPPPALGRTQQPLGRARQGAGWGTLRASVSPRWWWWWPWLAACGRGASCLCRICWHCAAQRGGQSLFLHLPRASAREKISMATRPAPPSPLRRGPGALPLRPLGCGRCPRGTGSSAPAEQRRCQPAAIPPDGNPVSQHTVQGMESGASLNIRGARLGLWSPCAPGAEHTERGGWHSTAPHGLPVPRGLPQGSQWAVGAGGAVGQWWTSESRSETDGGKWKWFLRAPESIIGPPSSGAHGGVGEHSKPLPSVAEDPTS